MATYEKNQLHHVPSPSSSPTPHSPASTWTPLRNFLSLLKVCSPTERLHTSGLPPLIHFIDDREGCLFTVTVHRKEIAGAIEGIGLPEAPGKTLQKEFTEKFTEKFGEKFGEDGRTDPHDSFGKAGHDDPGTDVILLSPVRSRIEVIGKDAPHSAQGETV